MKYIKLCSLSLWVVWSTGGVTPATAPPPSDAAVKVELTVAAEHVSKDLKAGAKVDLERVTAQVGRGATTRPPRSSATWRWRRSRSQRSRATPG